MSYHSDRSDSSESSDGYAVVRTVPLYTSPSVIEFGVNPAYSFSVPGRISPVRLLKTESFSVLSSLYWYEDLFSAECMTRSARSFNTFSSCAFICPGVRKRSAGSKRHAFSMTTDIGTEASHGAGRFSPEMRFPRAASLSPAVILSASGSRNGARLRFINL